MSDLGKFRPEYVLMYYVVSKDIVTSYVTEVQGLLLLDWPAPWKSNGEAGGQTKTLTGDYSC